MSRTVKPDGEKIKRLRTEKGWNVAHLAAEIQCSNRTVLSLEKGESCYLYTLANFAKALEVECKDITAARDPAPNPATRSGRMLISIKLDIDFSEFSEGDDLRKLIEHLKFLIDARHPIEIKKVEASSVKITLLLWESDELRLKAALLDGILELIGISSYKVIASERYTSPQEERGKGTEVQAYPAKIDTREIPAGFEAPSLNPGPGPRDIFGPPPKILDKPKDEAGTSNN